MLFRLIVFIILFAFSFSLLSSVTSMRLYFLLVLCEMHCMLLSVVFLCIRVFCVRVYVDLISSCSLWFR